MANIKAQLDALEQQHELTVMELTDLKEEYDRIKKLNNTMLENMFQQPSDMLNEIKVIIDGNLYNHKIIELEQQLDLLKSRMNDQVEKRVQQLMKNKVQSKTYKQKQECHEHDCQKCSQCRKLLQKCPNCTQLSQNYRVLQKAITEKNQKIDILRLQIEQRKCQFQIAQSRKNNERNEHMNELEKLNKILRVNIEQQQIALRQQQEKRQQTDRQWQYEYKNLQNQLNQALQELEQYKQYYENHRYGHEQNMERQDAKKQVMLQEIQNIVGSMGNRKSVASGNGPRMSKLYQNSRIGHDSDFSNFSIKDAINRPNQFTFY